MAPEDTTKREARADEEEAERLDRELIELLNELRVVMPGVQVLFGFLLTVPFQQRFTEVDDFQRIVYFATLVLTAASAAFLMGPSAFHRLTFREGQKPYLVELGTRQTIAGMALLAARDERRPAAAHRLPVRRLGRRGGRGGDERAVLLAVARPGVATQGIGQEGVVSKTPRSPTNGVRAWTRPRSGRPEGMTVLEVPQPTEPATPIVPEPSPVPADPEPPVEPGTPGGPVGPDVPEPDTPREDPIDPPAPAE